MSKQKVIVITTRHIIEIGNESDERITSYVVTAIKTAFRNIRGGSILTTIYDEQHNQLLGVDMSGTPSSELQEIFDDMIDKYEEPPAQVKVVPGKPRPG